MTSTHVTRQPFKSCPFSQQKAAHAMCHIAVHTSAHKPCQLGQAHEARAGTPSPAQVSPVISITPDTSTGTSPALLCHRTPGVCFSWRAD